MSLTIGKHAFEGPFSDTDDLKESSGIYVIVDERDGKYFPIDCGESANVKSRIDNHDRKDCWSNNSKGSLKVVVKYTHRIQSTGRVLIEQEIRSEFSFPCGER